MSQVMINTATACLVMDSLANRAMVAAAIVTHAFRRHLAEAHLGQPSRGAEFPEGAKSSCCRLMANPAESWGKPFEFALIPGLSGGRPVSSGSGNRRS